MCCEREAVDFESVKRRESRQLTLGFHFHVMQVETVILFVRDERAESSVGDDSQHCFWCFKFQKLSLVILSLKKSTI